MKLVDLSVTNYRSITNAHKITLQNLTVLVGKNNEGKSNLLTALNVAMTTLLLHCRSREASLPYNRIRQLYNWERDFPIQHQSRKNGLESIFKLNFRLENEELVEFHRDTGIRGNEDIPILIKYNRGNIPSVKVPKRGTSSYNRKSKKVAEFISNRISFNYIQAVRTEGMALDALKNVIFDELAVLNDKEEYIQSLKKITDMQQEVLDQIASQLIEPLRVFLPQLIDVKIQKKTDDFLSRIMRNDVDVIIDDGTPTSISFKGDGIKSLATLAILKDKRSTKAASIIAIEEPESHLHSGAIHSLVNVINHISDNNQVIITTHNPLFVQQNSLKSNILVNNGTARPAKSISEIRNILGVLPSDNLRNANCVFVVEGEDDKIALSKILSSINEKISTALKTNMLVIKPLGGAGNLSHDLADLKNCMCNYFVLMDNDESGVQATEKAVAKGLLNESQFKHTICKGSPKAEFEDCIKKEIYAKAILDVFSVDIDVSAFTGNQKWSDRMKATFLSQGTRWTDSVEKKVKLVVAEAIPNKIDNIYDVLIEQKSGFIHGVISSLERMLDNAEKNL
jgi:predicted ATP-dependent endonuclease of OLD family